MIDLAKNGINGGATEGPGPGAPAGVLLIHTHHLALALSDFLVC